MKKIIQILCILAAANSCKLVNSNKIPFYYKAFLTETVATATTISAITPTSGIEGDTVTITGTNFTADSVVTFGGSIVATISARTTESIAVTVPVGAKTGTIKVTTSSTSATSVSSYTVYRYFVYIPVVTNLEIYKFNPNTGSLSGVTGSPFTNILGNSGLTSIDPFGKFMYSTSTGSSNNIKSFTINPSTGIVTATSVPLSTAKNNPTYMDFHPSGKFVYFVNTGREVSAFSIDQSSGNLTKINDVPLNACGSCNLIQPRVTPDGKYLFVNGNGPSSVNALAINQTTGDASFIQYMSITGNADALLATPNSNYIYTVNQTGFNTISGFSVTSATGNFSQLAGSPFAGTTSNIRAAMHPSGNYLYTVNTTGAQLAKHDIASNGALSAPSTISFGTDLQFVSIDPSGKYGFVNNGGSSNYYIFSIDQTNGTPSLINGNPFTASGTPGAIFSTRIAQ